MTPCLYLHYMTKRLWTSDQHTHTVYVFFVVIITSTLNRKTRFWSMAVGIRSSATKLINIDPKNLPNIGTVDKSQLQLAQQIQLPKFGPIDRLAKYWPVEWQFWNYAGTYIHRMGSKSLRSLVKPYLFGTPFQVNTKVFITNDISNSLSEK